MKRAAGFRECDLEDDSILGMEKPRNLFTRELWGLGFGV